MKKTIKKFCKKIWHYIREKNFSSNCNFAEHILYQVLFAVGTKLKRKFYTGEFTNNLPIAYESWYECNEDFSAFKTDIKLLAFYLPQFHTFPENDAWWGKGFTEWTNTRKAIKMFPTHYQPREPHEDIGYYDLTDWHVMAKQAKLAKQHGIYGFCFYHYWFSGKRLMERPVDILLEHPEIDLHFCLCWANENWTRKWDGAEKDILIAQKYINDDLQYIVDLKKYVLDPRYIRVDNKPLIIVYRPSLLPNPERTFGLWKQWAKENGIGEITIWVTRGCAQSPQTAIVKNADAEVEFPPAFTTDFICMDRNQIGLYDYFGNVLDYRNLVSKILSKEGAVETFSHPVYRTAMLGWDNSARKQNNFDIWYGFSQQTYYSWLQYIIADTRRRHTPNERFMFINAWNEWAEGTYLEPDKKFGYTSLNTTSRALFGLPLKKRNELDSQDPRKPLSHLMDCLRQDLPQSTLVAPPPVDIIVPVFNGFEYLYRMLTSLLQQTGSEYRCIIVDDASSDKQVVNFLHEIVRNHSNFEYYRNPSNLGFVKTVNEALKKTTRHVILLNTDIELPENWLPRLLQPILANPKIASVTPFANAATLCSFPDFMMDCINIDGMSVNDINKYGFNLLSNDPPVEILTGVGFCMAMNRKAIDEIGFFCEDFGRGYGEENDWCLRAREKGYLNVAATNLYVFHNHGGTFIPEEKRELLEHNLQILHQKHPNYFARAQKYCEDDPLQKYRLVALLMLLSHQAFSTKLLVDFSLGGGTKLFQKRLIEKNGENILWLVLEFVNNNFFLTLNYNHNKYIFKISELNDLFTVLQKTGLNDIICTNLIYYTELQQIQNEIVSLKQLTGAKLTFQLHDYYCICPSYNLLDKDGHYCKMQCTNSCLTLNKYAAIQPCSIENWRTQWLLFLHNCDTITAFSETSKKILEEVYPTLSSRIEITPHDVTYFQPYIRKKQNQHTRQHKGITIAALGEITDAKGAKVLEKLAKCAPANHRVVVIGELHLPTNDIICTGRYSLESISLLVEKYEVDMIIIPSVWPETFCFTASEAECLNIPVACFDIGAQAARLQKNPNAILLPLSLIDTPVKIWSMIDNFLKKC